MKKVLVLLTIMGMFAITGCTKSPEAHCAQAMDNVMNIMMKGDHIKKMPKEALAKMKEGMAKQKEKGVKECVKDYDKDAVACAIKADTMKAFMACQPKKKKADKKK